MPEKFLLNNVITSRPVQIEQAAAKKDYGKFIIAPYEKGMAITIGNTLRRSLLSSIPGYAVSALKISGINSEFQNIKGVYEDTIDIIMNLKKTYITLKDPDIEKKVLHLEIKGEKEVYARALELDQTIYVHNKDLLIFKTNAEANFSLDLQIDYGRGFVLAEKNQDFIEVAGTIVIDALYSPVLKVAYKSIPLTGDSTGEFESLEIEIWTNGTINPEDALSKAAYYVREKLKTFVTVDNDEDIDVFTATGSQSNENVSNEDLFKKNVSILELSVRSLYFLKINDIKEVGQLIQKNEDTVKGLKEATNAILEEIKDKLQKKNLHLGMKDINYSFINV
ncbi:MAG: DNA-directed RNA polymerase subunit alpha [Spirochaetes bacterium GWF1_41_5]|nr:MAG: DNA-directed RNA polymerase subunit alpha [Spirochaetes bacterium GWF1_41_5]HBE03505.1 DNA-directed RNA polymerase subunit alpha [Spirochaetia bacterium]